ncbi:MAG: dihydroorotase [Planctomycetia bacterium]|nr:dihydroorotase [Planctomycetia bacterium]
MKTLIRHAQVVFPGEIAAVNVLLDGEKIAAVDAAEHARADAVVDARGLHLLPGLIDDQVHFREPGLTHKEDLHTGSRACAKGGVTTFLEMPNTVPPAINQERLDEKLRLAAEKSLVNYGFYIGATPTNLADLKTARRTPGIKIFIGSSTGELLVDDQAALERIFAETTLPICAHCEDESTIKKNAALYGRSGNVADHSKIRDVEAALVATKRAVDLALRHKHRFHVLHVSTAAEADFLLEKFGPGSRSPWPLVTAEVCPHHLFFNVDDYARLGTRVQMNPSLKTAADNERLWQALHEGTIQVVATDHAPHTLEEKAKPYAAGHGGSPSGLPAVENSLALMLDQAMRGQVTLLEIARWMSEAPARVWDIVGKGQIAAGYDADLVLVDLGLTETIRDAEQETKCRWSPWDGVALTGWPVRTWVMGREVFRDGKIADDVRGKEAIFAHDPGRDYWFPG